MRIIQTQMLIEFSEKHRELAEFVRTWLLVVREAEWKTPHDVRGCYPKASKIEKDQWWFDLNPGGYRIKVRINFKVGLVRILKILPHDDYLRESKKKRKS